MLEKKDITSAMRFWLEVYVIATKICNRDALNQLENLAKDIGLIGGLQGWGALYLSECSRKYKTLSTCVMGNQTSVQINHYEIFSISIGEMHYSLV
ncbi:MAG: hypothetical protein L3K52_04015 [Candidatus Thiothrix sulfatifontis]|nr:MAG: hypothetical protein L3K52_04015 [Candidatus Thiothrix sulfatifontis]